MSSIAFITVQIQNLHPSSFSANVYLFFHWALIRSTIVCTAESPFSVKSVILRITSSLAHTSTLYFSSRRRSDEVMRDLSVSIINVAACWKKRNIKAVRSQCSMGWKRTYEIKRNNFPRCGWSCQGCRRRQERSHYAKFQSCSKKIATSHRQFIQQKLSPRKPSDASSILRTFLYIIQVKSLPHTSSYPLITPDTVSQLFSESVFIPA